MAEIAVFSQKLHHCGASIAALRSSSLLRNHFSRVDYFYEESKNLGEVRAIYPNMHYHTVKAGVVDSYLEALERRQFQAAIFHNFVHPKPIMVRLAEQHPTLWMMHDASPATGVNYSAISLKQKKIVSYPLRSALPNSGDFEELSRRAFAFATPSEWLTKVARYFIGDDIPIFTIRNSVPKRYFHPLDKAASRAALGLPPNRFLLLFFAGAGAVARKNLQTVVEACRAVSSKDISFVAIGGLPADMGGLPENMILLPSFLQQCQPLRAAQLYSAADVFVIPSLVDNLPNTVLEAFNCGRPVIGAKTGGIPEMVIPQETGWLMPPEDGARLAHLATSLADNPQIVERMGAQALAYADEHFSEEGSTRQYVEAIERVAGLRRRNWRTSLANQNFARIDRGDPLYIVHDAPFYDVRKPTPLLASIVRRRPAKPDSHMTPYRKLWNPDRSELETMSFEYRLAGDGHAMNENTKRISRWYNAYRGRRAFLIGNGPSLNECDLSLLRDEITIGVNSIFFKRDELGGLPTHYVVEDNFVAEDRAEEINALEGTNKWFGNYLRYCLEGDDVNWLNVRMRYDSYKGFPYFSRDAARQVWTGGSVTYVCMQLAFYFGVRDLYLIGFDHHYVVPETTDIDGLAYTSQGADPNHFDPTYFGKGYRWHAPMTERMELGYCRAQKTFNQYGRNMYNATVGGKLEVLPRVEYASLFETPASSRFG
ncbi:MAG: glycosyltransferase [Pseudomonadota bacterium]